MKRALLKSIFKEINKDEKYDFDFDGEPVASDTINVEGNTATHTYNLSLKVWVKNSVYFGLQLEDAEVVDFQVWDLNGNEFDSEILDSEIIEQLYIF